MNSLTHDLTRKISLTLAALACLCFALIAPDPPRARAQDEDGERTASKEKPTSVVYGRVVYSDTERPVRRARVRLLGLDGERAENSGLTDANGEFRIKGVRAGRYFVMVDLAGLMSPVSFINIEELRDGGGSFDSEDARKYFDVIETDGKEDKQVNVRARRGAAIAGKVTYSDGGPAVNLLVQVMRRSDGRLAKFFTGTSGGMLMGMMTDDRGVYRVAGLPPGEYVVAVSESADHGDGGRDRDNYGSMMMMGMLSPQLLTTYHSSATSAKDAVSIKVGAGDEREGVDISIPDRALHVVSGIVRGRRDRSPIARAQVNILPIDDGTGASSSPYSSLMEDGVRTDEEGRWQLKDIPDGQYTITVKPSPEYEQSESYLSMNSNVTITNANVTITNANVSVNRNGNYTPPRRKRGYAPARQELKVSGDDVTDLSVELSEGGRVSGTIAVEGGKPPEYAHIYVVQASRPDEMMRGEMPSATAMRGEFTIEGLSAGKFFLHATTYSGEGKKLYLKSITWNGRDILREPLDVGEGATLEGVRVVFSSDPATLKARVVSADSKPALNINVFLVPADSPNWSPYSAQSFFCSTGEEGECSSSAPPGEYAVVAMPRRDIKGAIGDEIQKRVATSPRITLRAGETKSFEVKMAGEK